MRIFDWVNFFNEDKSLNKELVLFGGPKLYNSNIKTLDYYMSEALGLTPKNFSMPRTSNLQIFNDATKYIISSHSSIGCVVICWMELPILTFGIDGYNTRNDFKFNNVHLMDFGSFNAILSRKNYPESSIPEVEFPLEDERNLFDAMCENNMIFGEKYTNELMRYITIIQKLCQKHNIPSIQAYAGNSKSVNDRTMKNFKSSLLYYSIDPSMFYGYPINDTNGSLYLFKDCDVPTKDDYQKASKDLLRCIRI